METVEGERGADSEGADSEAGLEGVDLEAGSEGVDLEADSGEADLAPVPAPKSTTVSPSRMTSSASEVRDRN